MPTYDSGTSGLTGTVGVTILHEDGTVHSARSTAGITEPVAGSGVYHVAHPAVGTLLTFVWDEGVGTIGASESTDGVVPNATAPLDATATANAAATGADAALTAAHTATREEVSAARDTIAAAIEEHAEVVTDGVEITPLTLGTNGLALGRVQPNAEVFVYLGGIAKRKFYADADGDYSYKLPPGSTWTLRAVAPAGLEPGYLDIILEVTT